jgi:hypothetical protein
MLSNGGQVVNNTVDRHWYIGVAAMSGQGNFPTSSVVVSGNRLMSVDVGSGNGAITVLSDGPLVSNITVSGNWVVGADDAGILLRGAGAGAISGITVSGNTITGACRIEQSGGSVFLDRVGAAAVFSNVALDANDLEAGGRYGFWLEGTTVAVRARDNVVRSQAAGPFNFAAPASFAEYSRNSPVTVAQLGLLANSGIGDGSVQRCSDCRQTSPCRGSGPGATARRVNGAWLCR